MSEIEYNSSDEMVFDEIKPKLQPVRIGKVKYALKPADAGVAITFRNAQMAAIRFKGNSIANFTPEKLEGVADLEAILVQMCLFQVTTNNNNEENLRPVSDRFVRALPPKTLHTLFIRAKEISDLLEEEQTVEALKSTREKIDKQIESLEKDTVGN